MSGGPAGGGMSGGGTGLMSGGGRSMGSGGRGKGDGDGCSIMPADLQQRGPQSSCGRSLAMAIDPPGPEQQNKASHYRADVQRHDRWRRTTESAREIGDREKHGEAQE